MITDEMLVSFKEFEKDKQWSSCLNALDTDFTISMREICQLLKCDRTWVNRYIKPFVHHIYISNGYSKKSAPFTYLASIALNREIKDSIWFNKKEFEQFIRSHFNKFTRQTIQIPLEWLLQYDKIENVKADYKFYTDQMEQLSITNYKKYNDLKKLRDASIERSLSEIGIEIWKMLPDKYRRSECQHVEIDTPEFELTSLLAVHDIMDYGDTAEMVYRNLFSNGCIRTELILEDKTRKKSNKIYYLDPNDEIRKSTITNVLISYKDYKTFRLEVE